MPGMNVPAIQAQPSPPVEPPPGGSEGTKAQPTAPGFPNDRWRQSNGTLRARRRSPSAAERRAGRQCLAAVVAAVALITATVLAGALFAPGVASDLIALDEAGAVLDIGAASGTNAAASSDRNGSSPLAASSARSGA